MQSRSSLGLSMKHYALFKRKGLVHVERCRFDDAVLRQLWRPLWYCLEMERPNPE